MTSIHEAAEELKIGRMRELVAQRCDPNGSLLCSEALWVAHLYPEEPHPDAIDDAIEEFEALYDGIAAYIQQAKRMEEALRLVYAALMSDPPDHGAQKVIVGDETIYRLDGQTMYRALNAVRAALPPAQGQKT